MHENPSWSIVSQKAAADIDFQALIPAVVLTTLALITVILRWYSRVKLSGVYGVEDVVVTLALIFSMAFTGIMGGEFSIDFHSTQDEGKALLFTTILKMMFAGSLFYHIAVNLIRFSILFQYHRLFSHMSYFCLCIYAVGLATLGEMAWGVFGIVFLCRPLRKYWQGGISGTCMDAEEHFWSCSLFGIVLDCLIWFMPMPVLGRLRLEGRQKMGLLVPFGLGLFVCVVSILRIVHVHGAAEKGNVSKSGSYAAIWSTAEINVAIICSSLLVMKPLVARLTPRLGVKKIHLAHEKDSGSRRMMSITTLAEPLTVTEEPVEARYEAHVWTDRGKNAREGQTRVTKESV